MKKVRLEQLAISEMLERCGFEFVATFTKYANETNTYKVHFPFLAFGSN